MKMLKSFFTYFLMLIGAIHIVNDIELYFNGGTLFTFPGYYIVSMIMAIVICLFRFNKQQKLNPETGKMM